MKKREIGLDVLRVVAVLSVLSVHFFANTDYYLIPITGLSLKIQQILRNFLLICVPLFLMITGYLNREKEYNIKFFKKLGNILIIWLIYSVIEITTINIINNNVIGLLSFNTIYEIMSFEACHYSWYIEMYIGIYLLSPIINNAFDKFDNKQKLILFCIILFICFIPTTFNIFLNGYFSIPDYWVNLYPFGYYIIGKCINNSNISIKPWILFVSFILNQFIMYICSARFVIDYNSICVLINSLIIFISFYKINIKSEMLKKIILHISIISLDIYLVSSLIDQILYPFFKDIFNFEKIGQGKFLIYSPCIIMSVFIFAFLIGTFRKKIIKIRA